MFDTLIINARRELGWQRRAASDLSTAMLWIGWILMWTPVFRKLREVVRLHVRFELAAREVLKTVTPISVGHAVVALLGTTTLLLLWSLLPKRRVIHAHATLTTTDHARHFGIDERQVASGLQSRICVVNHDDDGAVTGITPLYPPVQAPMVVPAPVLRFPQLEAA